MKKIVVLTIASSLFGNELTDLQQQLNNLSNAPQALQFRHFCDHEIAQVRYSPIDDISQEEKIYQKKRLLIVKKSIEQMLSLSLSEDRIPKIALCFSGGGFRSMLMSLGFLMQAERSGLLNAISYIATLSGSTWAIAPWIASENSVNNFSRMLNNRIAKNVTSISEHHAIKKIVKNLINKLLAHQSVSCIDIFGNILAKTLLGTTCTNPFEITLTESHKNVYTGMVPLPIYTTIKANTHPYEWMEITPFEVGSSYLKSYIPTWAFGRMFFKGVSCNNAPEQTLAYFLGLFGSAFHVNLKDIIRLSAETISAVKTEIEPFFWKPLKTCIQYIVHSSIGDMRFFPSIFANFSYQHPESPLADDKTISLVDAGIDFNIPLPPLLRKTRMLDMIIIYDSSVSVTGAPELRRAVEYAQRKGIALPTIDYEHIHERVVSIFKDEQDYSKPIIVYFPRIKNDHYSTLFDPERCIESDYCNTFNFNYTAEQISLLQGLVEFTLKEQQGCINTLIRELLTKKYGYSC